MSYDPPKQYSQNQEKRPTPSTEESLYRMGWTLKDLVKELQRLNSLLEAKTTGKPPQNNLF